MENETFTEFEEIVALRNRYNINQGELAKEAGANRQSIVDFEKGRLTKDNLKAAVLRAAEKKCGNPIPA